MRIDFEIDDKLMRDALQATGMKTEREVVEEVELRNSEARSIGGAISMR